MYDQFMTAEPDEAVKLAQRRIEEANAEGGYGGIPFRLVSGWSENPWGTGITRVTRMAYSDHVWAVIGSIDGASTHLAEQVVAKARLTLINPASTDKTLNPAHVAWMFSCLPGDHQLAPVLARALVDRIGTDPFTLLSSTDHDSRVFTTELERKLAPGGVDRAPVFLLTLCNIRWASGRADKHGSVDLVRHTQVMIGKKLIETR